MDADVTQAADGMTTCDKVLQELDDGGKAFEDHIFELEKVACARAADMTAKVEASRVKLLEELTEMRHARMKKVQTVRQEVEMHQVCWISIGDSRLPSWRSLTRSRRAKQQQQSRLIRCTCSKRGEPTGFK